MFKEMGLQRLEGDEAMYYKKSASGELEGIVSTHIDDFSLAGKAGFLKVVTDQIKKILDVSKIEDGKFRYTGIIS